MTSYYCNPEDVVNLFGDISDDVSEDMLVTALENTTGWIDANLRRNYLPLPVIELNIDGDVDDIEVEASTNNSVDLTSVPTGLRTAAVYYTASDILLSLYHGDELPVQYDVWFTKAQNLLDAYIDAAINTPEDPVTDANHRRVRHSHSLTYHQKRRGGARRWRI